MAVKETVELKVVVTPELSQLTSLEQKLQQPHNVNVGLNTAEAEKNWGKLKGNLNKAITPQINETQLFSLNSHIDLKLRHWSRLKQTLETGITPKLDLSAFSKIPTIHVPVVADTSKYKRDIKNLTADGDVLGAINGSLTFNSAQLANTIERAIRNSQKQKADVGSIAKTIAYAPIKAVSSTVGSIATAPFKLAGDVIGNTATVVLRGAGESIGKSIASPISDYLRRQSLATARKIDDLANNTFNEKSLAVFIGEMMNSGSVVQATSAAAEYGGASENLKVMNEFLRKSTKIIDSIQKLSEVNKDLSTLTALATTPVGSFATSIKETSPRVYDELEKIVNEARQQKGKDPVSLDKAGRREVLVAAKTLETQARKVPVEVMQTIVEPALSSFGETIGKFVGTIQAYRTAMTAQSNAMQQLAEGVQLASEDATGMVQVIGGAQFAQGEGGAQVAARLESLLKGASVVPVQNPDTDNVAVSNLTQSPVYKMLENLAKSTGVLSGNKGTDETAMNAIRQVAGALDPAFISSATKEAVTNVLVAKEQGIGEERQAITSYSLGGAELLRVARTLEFLGINIKQLAQAYPAAGLTGEKFGGNFQSTTLKGDPLNFSYDIGAINPPEFQTRLNSRVQGMEAHADKHLYKVQEFLEIFYSTFQGVADLDHDSLVEASSSIATFQHSIGGSLYELLGSMEQAKSLLETGEFNLESPIRAFSPGGDASSVDILAKVFESYSKVESSKGEGTVEQQALTERLLQELSPIIEKAKEVFASVGIKQDSSAKELFSVVKFLQQAAQRNLEIKSFLGEKLSSEESSKAYFAAADVDDSQRGAALTSRLAAARAGLSYFSNMSADMGEYGGKIVKVYRTIIAAMQEMAETGNISEKLQKNLLEVKLDDDILNDKITSLLSGSLDTLSLPSFQEKGLPKGSSPINYVLGEATESTDALAVAIQHLGNVSEGVKEILDITLGKIASGKINRSPLSDEDDVSKKLSELSVRDWATVAKEDIASVLFEIQSIGNEFSNQLEVARPFFRLSFSSWKALIDLAGELSDTILPAIPGGETTKKLAQNVGVPIAIAGAVSMLSPEAYAALHSAATALTETGLSSAELLLQFQTAVGEAVPALQPFTALGENALKLANWLAKVPGAGGVGQGLLEGAGVVGTGALAKKGIKDTIGAVTPQVIKEEIERASLSPAMRKMWDKQKDVEAAPSFKFTLEQYDEIKPQFTAANRRVKSLLSRAEKFMEQGMDDLALTLVVKAKNIQEKLNSNFFSASLELPERRRSINAFRGNSQAQLKRIVSMEESLSGANILPPVNVSPDTRKQGEDIVQGVIEGAESKAAEFHNSVANLAREGQEQFKKSNEIQSPSKIYARYGAMLGEGASKGVLDSIPTVKASIDKLSSEVYDSIDSRGANPAIHVDAAMSTVNDSVAPTIEKIKELVGSISGIGSNTLKNISVMSTPMRSINTQGAFTRQDNTVHLNAARYVGGKYGIESQGVTNTIAHELRHAAQLYAETNNVMMRYLKPQGVDKAYVERGVRASTAHRKGQAPEQLAAARKREEDAYTFELQFAKAFSHLSEAFATRKDNTGEREVILKALKAIKYTSTKGLPAEKFPAVNINMLKAFRAVGSASEEFTKDMMTLVTVLNSYHPDAEQGKALSNSAAYQTGVGGDTIGKSVTDGLDNASFDESWLVPYTTYVDRVKDVFGIASPSKVFANIRKNIDEGFSQGNIALGSEEILHLISMLDELEEKAKKVYFNDASISEYLKKVQEISFTLSRMGLGDTARQIRQYNPKEALARRNTAQLSPAIGGFLESTGKPTAEILAASAELFKAAKLLAESGELEPDRKLGLENLFAALTKGSTAKQFTESIAPYTQEFGRPLVKGRTKPLDIGLPFEAISQGNTENLDKALEQLFRTIVADLSSTKTSTTSRNELQVLIESLSVIKRGWKDAEQSLNTYISAFSYFQTLLGGKASPEEAFRDLNASVLSPKDRIAQASPTKEMLGVRNSLLQSSKALAAVGIDANSTTKSLLLLGAAVSKFEPVVKGLPLALREAGGALVEIIYNTASYAMPAQAGELNRVGRTPQIANTIDVEATSVQDVLPTRNLLLPSSRRVATDIQESAQIFEEILDPWVEAIPKVSEEVTKVKSKVKTTASNVSATTLNDSKNTKPQSVNPLNGLRGVGVAWSEKLQASLNRVQKLTKNDREFSLKFLSDEFNAELSSIREFSEELANLGDVGSLKDINKELTSLGVAYSRLLSEGRRSGVTLTDNLTPLRKDITRELATVKGSEIASKLPSKESAATAGAETANALDEAGKYAAILGENLLALKAPFMQIKEIAVAFGGPVVGQIANSVGAVAERFGILKAGGTGAFLAVALAVGAYTTAQAGLAQEVKSLSLQFKALGYDGESSIERMFRLSQKTGTSFRQTAKLGAGIAGALQFTGIENQTIKLTEQIVKVNTALQLGADESQRFETALVQMLSKGVVSMEEVRQQAAEAVPSFFPALARGLDMTPGEAMKAISSGEVSSAEAVPAALEELTKMSAGSYEEGLRSLPASLNRINNSMTEINATFGAAPLDAMSTIARTFANILEAATPLIKFLAPLASAFVLVGGVKALILAAGFEVVQKAFGLVSAGIKLFTVEVVTSSNAFIGSITKYISGITGLQGAAAGLATGGLIVGLGVAVAAVGGLIHHIRNYNKEFKDLLKEINGAEVKPNEALLAATESPTSSNPVTATLDLVPQTVNSALIAGVENDIKVIEGYLESGNTLALNLTFGGVDKAKEKLGELEKELLEMKKEGGPLDTFGKNESIDKRFGPEASKVQQEVGSIIDSFNNLSDAQLKAYAIGREAKQSDVFNIEAQIALESSKATPNEALIDNLQTKAIDARQALEAYDKALTPSGGLEKLQGIQAGLEKIIKEREKAGDTEGVEFYQNFLGQVKSAINRTQKFVEANPILIQLAVAEGKFQDAENALLVNFNETRIKFLEQRAGFAITEEQLGLKEAQAEKINAKEKLKNLSGYIRERSAILKAAPGAASLANALGISAGDFESTGFETASLEKLYGLIQDIEKGAPGSEKYANTLEAVKELRQGIVDLSGARLEAAEATRREVQANVSYLASLRDVLAVVLRVNAARESMQFGLDRSQTQAHIGLTSQRLSGDLSGSEYDIENARLSMEQLGEKIQINSQHMADLNAALVELTAQEKAQASELIGNDISSASYGELKDFLARKEQADALGQPFGNANIAEAARARIAQFEVGNENLQLEEQQMEAARAQLVEVTASQLRQYRASIRNFNQSVSDYIQQMNDQLEDTNAEIRNLQSQTNLLRSRNELREHLLGAVSSIDTEFFGIIIDAVSSISDIINTEEIRQNARAIRDLTKQNTRTIQSTMDELASINEQRYDLAGVSQPGSVSLGNKLENTDEDRLGILDEALSNTGVDLTTGLQSSTQKILNASNNFGGALESGASVLDKSQKAAYEKLMSMGAEDYDGWQSSPGVFMASASKLAEQQGMADLRAEYNAMRERPKTNAEMFRGASIYSAFGGKTKEAQEAALNDFKSKVGDFFEQDFVSNNFGKIGDGIEGESNKLTADMNAAFEKTLAALKDKGTAIANLNREKIAEILLGAKEGFESLTRKLPETIMQLKQNLRQLDNSIADFGLSGAVVLTPQQRQGQQERQRVDTFEGLKLTLEQTRTSFIEAGALLSGDANAETIEKLNSVVDVLASQGVSPQEQALAKESAARLRELIDSFAVNGDRVELQNTLQEGLAGLTNKQNELLAANNQALANNIEAARQQRNAQRANIAQSLGGALTDTANTLNISQIDKDYIGSKATYEIALASQAKELDDFRNSLIEAGTYSDELFNSFKNLSDLRLERLKDDVRVIETTIRDTLKSGLDGGLNSALDGLLDEGKLDFGKLALDFEKSIIKGIAQPGIDVLSTGLSNVLTTGKWKGNKGATSVLTEGRDTLKDFSKGLSPQLMEVKANVVNIDGQQKLGSDILSQATSKNTSELKDTLGAFKTPDFSSLGRDSSSIFGNTGIKSRVSYDESTESFEGLFGNLGSTLTTVSDDLAIDVGSFAETAGSAFSQGAGAIGGAVASIPSIMQAFSKGDVGGGILGIISTALPLIGAFADGGTASLDGMLSNERAMSGRNPLLAVVHEGEEILTTKNDDAATFRTLKNAGAWDLIKEQTKNYATGGTVGRMNSAGASIFGNRSHSSQSTSSTSNTFVLPGVKDRQDFGRSQTQIVNKQELAQRQASRRMTNK